MYTFLCATFYFAMYVAMIGLRYFFIFYAKYSVEKTWAALNLLLSFIRVFREKKMFHVFINLFLFFLLPLKCKTCTNLNLFCSVAKLYDSGHFIEVGKKHHTYFLCIVWLYFDFLFVIFVFLRLTFSTFLSPRVDCIDINDIFLMSHISFHYE